MRNKYLSNAALVCLLLCIGQVLAADQATTQKAIPLQNTNSTTTTTTPKPKIDVFASSLCKKCTCDQENKQLDCTNKTMSTLFTDEEWNTLQNGNFIFETIKLEHNKIKKVPKFRAYPVQNLYLGFNEIASIENAAFSELTKLTKLGLAHNQLSSKTLVPEVFQGQYSVREYLPIDTMQELDLGHNDLHTLDSDLFENLPKLEVLVLCENSFQVINKMAEIAISGLLYLKTLDLSYMELKDIPDNFLHSLRNLETLILSGNLFTEIPDEVQSATNLKQLVLDENLITNFMSDNRTLKLNKLEYLSISNMPELTEIGKGAFSQLRSLRVLVASDNPKLSNIDAQAFSTVTSNPMILDYPPIRKLYLRNNNLTVLDRDLLVRWDKVNPIDLSYNPWICDCTNDWLVHVLMTQINSTTPLLTKNIVCDSPSNWKNALLMDINANKIVLECHSTRSSGGSIVLVSILVGVLIGIPMTIAAIFLYRRGCFTKRRQRGGDRALYDRAEFSDDFHT